MSTVARWITEYDTEEFPFAQVMLKTLGLRDFSELPSGKDASVGDPAEVNRHYRQLLKSLPIDNPLGNLYQKFVSDFVARHFGKKISLTQRPVLRVQIAHSPSISGMHRDSEYIGRWDYLNGWLPMLDVPAESALHVETNYGSGVLEPVPLRYGQVLFFDAGMLAHGSPSNETDQPRVSMDFRFVPKSPSTLQELIVGSRPLDLVASAQANFALLHRTPAQSSDSAEPT